MIPEPTTIPRFGIEALSTISCTLPGSCSVLARVTQRAAVLCGNKKSYSTKPAPYMRTTGTSPAHSPPARTENQNISNSSGFARQPGFTLAQLSHFCAGAFAVIPKRFFTTHTRTRTHSRAQTRQVYRTRRPLSRMSRKRYIHLYRTDDQFPDIPG